MPRPSRGARARPPSRAPRSATPPRARRPRPGSSPPRAPSAPAPRLPCRACGPPSPDLAVQLFVRTPDLPLIYPQSQFSPPAPNKKASGFWATDLRFRWSRGQDLNLRPPGYEPGELPDCSTPQCVRTARVSRKEEQYSYPEAHARTFLRHLDERRANGSPPKAAAHPPGGVHQRGQTLYGQLREHCDTPSPAASGKSRSGIAGSPNTPGRPW